MERNILSENNNPVISFENYLISEMKFRKLSDEDEKNKFGINIGVDESKKFVKLKVFLSTERDIIEVEMIGEFEFSDEIKEEEKTKFLKINGAAILYPYVRAYISNISSFDKEALPIIIPTVNFQQIYENEEERANN